MFSEQEVGEETDFIPSWHIMMGDLCKKCRYNEICPYNWSCKTLRRWYNADMDNDDTL